MRVSEVVMVAGILTTLTAAAPRAGTAQVQNPVALAPLTYPEAQAQHRMLLHERALRELNKQRQERVVTDSARLLDIATELRRNADEPSANQAPLDMIREAEDIERLARQVKQGMRG